MIAALPYSPRVRQQDEALEREVLAAAAAAAGPLRLEDLVRSLSPARTATAVREAVWRLLNDGVLDAAEDWRLSLARNGSTPDEQSTDDVLVHAVG